MHFIQPPQDIVAKLLQKRKISAISGRWLSQVHTQKKFWMLDWRSAFVLCGSGGTGWRGSEQKLKAETLKWLQNGT